MKEEMMCSNEVETNMQTIVALENESLDEKVTPGSQLTQAREKKGYSQDYVAGKLHLRVKVIQQLESDDYQQMPEPVFVKGYLRAYAKLLGLSPDLVLTAFNELYVNNEGKRERTLLWQSKRTSHTSERFLRWTTALLILSLIVAIGFWWEKNKETQGSLLPVAAQVEGEVPTKTASSTDVRLTDLSKMRSVLAPHPVMSIVEQVRA